MSAIILFLPLVGAIVSGFFHNQIGEKLVKIISTFCVLLSCIISWKMFLTDDFSTVEKVHILKWIS